MPVIHIETKIQAPVYIVFDLARSIDLHVKSLEHTNEIPTEGKTSGLIELGEYVMWKSKHFGIYHKLSSKITEFKKNEYFVDEMQKGIFKRFKHEHIFKTSENETIMEDIFKYTSPLGILGRLADIVFVEKYMQGLLTMRNQVIKEYAETDKWKTILYNN